MKALERFLFGLGCVIVLVKFGYGGFTERTISEVVAMVAMLFIAAFVARVIVWLWRVSIRSARSAPDAAITVAHVAGKAASRAERSVTNLVGAFRAGRKSEDRDS